LALGVTGTLAQFTASITNTDNVVQTHGPEDFGFSETLIDNGEPVDNPEVAPCATANAGQNSTCSLINKYGAVGAPATPMEPGATRSTSVRLTNIAVPNGLSGNLALEVEPCTPTVPVGDPNSANGGTAAGDICGTITVEVSCTGLATDIGPLTLTNFAAGSPYPIATAVPPGGEIDCTFTVEMPLTASNPNLQGLSANQPLTWTWTQA